MKRNAIALGLTLTVMAAIVLAMWGIFAWFNWAMTLRSDLLFLALSPIGFISVSVVIGVVWKIFTFIRRELEP